MKILLLNGPATKNFARTGRWQATSRGASLWYPIWLASCCSVLEDAGHKVKLIDAPAYGYDLERTMFEIESFMPELCVLDTSAASISYDLETAEWIKEVSQDIKICMVGPHASVRSKTLLKNRFVDFVMIGEYEHAVLDLANSKSLEFWNGLMVKWRGVENLDFLPFASRSLFKHLDINKYNLDFCLHPYMTIMTSRGCPHKCTFCLWPQTLTKGKYRERSLPHVFAEIAYVIRQKVKEIFFDDDTFTVNKERVKEFCERYKCWDTPFSVNARADVDYKTLKCMKDAGLRCLVVGFESGNQEILDNVKKNITLEQMKDFADICHRLKIQVHGDFVIGLPGENKGTIEKTVKFAKGLSLSTFQMSIASPLPGTEFYRWLDENDYLTTRDFSKWIDKDGMQRCVISYPDLSNTEIERAVYDSIRKYYFSFGFLGNVFKQIINSPLEFKRYLKGGLRFCKYLKGGKK